jgi:hypothetical protein
MQKSKPQSKQAPIYTTIDMKLFSLFQHHSIFLKPLFEMKTKIDQWSKYTLIQRYSLRPIILFTNMDVSRHILMVDTSVLAKSNMGRREYNKI